jgi:hypothetical protein
MENVTLDEYLNFEPKDFHNIQIILNNNSGTVICHIEKIQDNYVVHTFEYRWFEENVKTFTFNELQYLIPEFSDEFIATQKAKFLKLKHNAKVQ